MHKHDRKKEIMQWIDGVGIINLAVMIFKALNKNSYRIFSRIAHQSTSNNYRNVIRYARYLEIPLAL